MNQSSYWRFSETNSLTIYNYSKFCNSFNEIKERNIQGTIIENISIQIDKVVIC